MRAVFADTFGSGNFGNGLLLELLTDFRGAEASLAVVDAAAGADDFDLADNFLLDELGADLLLADDLFCEADGRLDFDPALTVLDSADAFLLRRL